ncbi:MAG: LOG family protein [Patescibacteria group bacterium]
MQNKSYSIAFLGGAAWREDDEPYKDAFNVAKAVAEAGFHVVNGGGPGVMRASTKGAHAGGCNDVLAITYHPNKPKRHYEGVDPKNDYDFEVKTLDYFDRTKVMLQTTEAHIVFRGSIGTLSEFGMTWISSWIHDPHNKPIILYGSFWDALLDTIESTMKIDLGERNMFEICTSPEEVVSYLKQTLTSTSTLL